MDFDIFLNDEQCSSIVRALLTNLFVELPKFPIVESIEVHHVYTGPVDLRLALVDLGGSSPIAILHSRVLFSSSSQIILKVNLKRRKRKKVQSSFMLKLENFQLLGDLSVFVNIGRDQASVSLSELEDFDFKIGLFSEIDGESRAKKERKFRFGILPTIIALVRQAVLSIVRKSVGHTITLNLPFSLDWLMEAPLEHDDLNLYIIDRLTPTPAPVIRFMDNDNSDNHDEFY
ncbi:hypothetical protein PCE1_001922 [Barthelona sp. PCE]